MDEGAGVPSGREREIFETFKRFEGSDRSKRGAGLGLVIVKGLAEAMGLAVDAAHRSDCQGAGFTIHFPDELLVRNLDEDLS